MKKSLLLMLLTACTAFSPLTQAHPGPYFGPGPGPGPGPHYYPGHRVDVLPDIATALLIGGLTYYVANGIYYQRQNDHYVVVDTPSTVVVEAPTSRELRPLDFNGHRYYVNDGHYYERDIDGHYLEVPRPPGL